jgi:hypothetical protein
LAIYLSRIVIVVIWASTVRQYTWLILVLSANATLTAECYEVCTRWAAYICALLPTLRVHAIIVITWCTSAEGTISWGCRSHAAITARRIWAA